MLPQHSAEISLPLSSVLVRLGGGGGGGVTAEIHSKDKQAYQRKDSRKVPKRMNNE